MKYKIQFEGDLYEDGMELRQYALLPVILSSIDDVNEIVRTRLKYSEEPISDNDQKLLEDIQSALYFKELN